MLKKEWLVSERDYTEFWYYYSGWNFSFEDGIIHTQTYVSAWQELKKIY